MAYIITATTATILGGLAAVAAVAWWIHNGIAEAFGYN